MGADCCPEVRQGGLTHEFAASEPMQVRKAGWLLKRDKLGWRWLRRWYSLCSADRSVTYTSSPSQDPRTARAILPGALSWVGAVEKPAKRGKQIVYGFQIRSSTGRQRTLYCDSIRERDSWVWYLARLGDGQVSFEERYQADWGTVLGSGTYADVVKATDRLSGEAVAIKAAGSWACEQHAGLIEKEVQVMHRVEDHPHLLPLREVFHSIDRVFVVTELLHGGDLCGFAAGRRQHFHENEVRLVLRQILAAVAALHARGIAHCDIKPENILLSSRTSLRDLKLIDYNSAIYWDELTEPGGTAEYLAPELLCNDRARQGMGPGLDMWAVGVLAYWLLSGRTPFAADTIPGVLLNVLTARYAWPADCRLPEGAKDVISSLLRQRPEERPSAEQLLNHPWIQAEGRPACSPFEAVQQGWHDAAAKPGQRTLDVHCMPARSDEASFPAVSEVNSILDGRCGIEMATQQSSSALQTLGSRGRLSIKTEPPSPRSEDEPGTVSEELDSLEFTSGEPEDCPFAIEGSALELVPYERETSSSYSPSRAYSPDGSDGRDPLDSCTSIHEGRASGLRSIFGAAGPSLLAASTRRFASRKSHYAKRDRRGTCRPLLQNN